MNSASPDNPELIFRRGETGSLACKNEDPMTYPVEWYLALSNTSTVLARGIVVLPGGSTVPVDFNVPSDAFAFSLSGLIKEPKQEGRLVLQFAPRGGGRVPGPPDEDYPREGYTAILVPSTTAFRQLGFRTGCSTCWRRVLSFS